MKSLIEKLFILILFKKSMQNKFEILLPECMYHIYNRANGFENLFYQDENYRFFLQQWGKYIRPIADTLCYCLMPNHFHFMVKIREAGVLKDFFKEKLDKKLEELKKDYLSKLLSQQFSHMFNGYTQALNKQQKRRGSLFMHSFKRKKIEDDTYLINLFYYIHLNPVHHGFCSDFRDWKYSSFYDLVSDKSRIINQELAFQYFSDKQNFIDCHENKISLNEEYCLE
jgi:putative transposase